jgi:DNA-directed RNA polymerase specialized sigma24 family protein
VLAWLYTVARRRFAEPAKTTADYGPVVARALEEALGELPGGQSRVVVLKLLHGMTFAEIGADVGLTEAAAKLRFKGALEAVRVELIERGVEP